MNTPDAFDNLLANLRPVPLPASLAAKAQQVAQIMAAQAPIQAANAALVAHEMAKQPAWLTVMQNPAGPPSVPMLPMSESPLHFIGRVEEADIRPRTNPVIGGQGTRQREVTNPMWPMSQSSMQSLLGRDNISELIADANGLLYFGTPSISEGRLRSNGYDLIRGSAHFDGSGPQFTDSAEEFHHLLFADLSGPLLQPPGTAQCPHPCGCLLAAYVSGPFDTQCTPPTPYWVVDVIYERCAERWFVCNGKWVGMKKSNKVIVVSTDPLVWIFEFEDGPVRIGGCEITEKNIPRADPVGTIPVIKLGAGFLIWAPGCSPYYQQQVARTTEVWEYCPENGRTPQSDTRFDPPEGSFGPDPKTGPDPGAISQPGGKVDGSGDHPGLVTPSGTERNAKHGDHKVQKYSTTVETVTFLYCGPNKTFLGAYEETTDSEVVYDCGEPNKAKSQDSRSSRKGFTSAKDLTNPKNRTKRDGLERKLGGAYPGSTIDHPDGRTAPK